MRKINDRIHAAATHSNSQAYFHVDGTNAEISHTVTRLHFSWGRRLPLIRQSEAAECGLACLAMISGYYGNHVDLPSLRRKFALSLKGITVARLIEMAQSLNLSCRPLRLELDELSQLQLPCILHWDLDHFVVLNKISGGNAVIHDPALGERRMRICELNPHFSGIAIELAKGPHFKRKPPIPPVSLRTLAGSIHGLGRALAVIFSLAFVLELFTLLWPQFLQMVVDQVLADRDHDLLTFLALSFLLLLFMQTLVSSLRTWTVMWLGMHFNLSWAGNVFQHLLRLPQAYFFNRHLGDIVSRFGAVSVIQQTLTTKFVAVILDGLMATLTLAVMIIYSPLLSGLVLAALLLYAGTRWLYFRAYFESNLSQITVSAKQQSCFMEAVRGVQTIRLNNQGPSQTARYLNATTDALNTTIGVQKLNLVFGSINGLTTGAQRLGVLWLGAWLALKGQFSAGMLIAFVAYADEFTGRAASLIDYVIKLKLLRLQGERLADIVLTSPEPYAESTYVGPTPELSIQFENVSFRYADGEPWIVKKCNFNIKAGESVAIIGPSGCGKSTLARLMLGLIDPQDGVIRVGGVDLKHLGKNVYRKSIGSVVQDDTLFAGTIAENISFNDLDATPASIEAAARLAELHKDIVAMPMGYHSLIGDMGSSLSGGQKQRLYLARALYRKPQILILDEATSHLDISCEMEILANLKSMNVTRIMIAHRKETIRNADRVLHFINGQIFSDKTCSVEMEDEIYDC